MKTTNYWKLHFKHSMTGMHISNRVYIEILRNTRPLLSGLCEGKIVRSTSSETSRAARGSS
ncbi:hypothetical protein GYH30_026865 [Glycine max]|uniref:Uncharacterized protein n=1 Tax=Glycine max TaxID=3847 RepID=A0A0R0HU00_SOYBN|nr:hypothetical protein GYH30_026865 [Glycine max]